MLLFFIERDELDIYDIPIAKVTNDFLAYIRQMEEMNIDLASEFVLVAATLCRIKAKMLIPRKPIDEEGNEIDPREELVSRLLEYKRYKSVLEEMRELERDRSLRLHRGNAVEELRTIAERALVDSELEHLSLFKLLQSFERLMQRLEDQQKQIRVHQILQFSYTIEEQQQQVFQVIRDSRRQGRRAGFEAVFGHCRNRVHAIVTFLALLELLNLQQLRIVTGEGLNTFWLEEPGEEEE